MGYQGSWAARLYDLRSTGSLPTNDNKKNSNRNSSLSSESNNE